MWSGHSFSRDLSQEGVLSDILSSAPKGRPVIAQDEILGCVDKLRKPCRGVPMPQSLAQILVHLVFSTRNREPWLDDVIRDMLHGYIGGIVQARQGTLIRAGSVADHVHLLILHPRTLSPAELVQDIKTASSKWLKTQHAKYAAFHWQSGYGVFSVSPSIGEVEAYIANQAEHHRKMTFQEEYRRLLQKCGMEFDERYVWD
jgi:putative transposase